MKKTKRKGLSIEKYTVSKLNNNNMLHVFGGNNDAGTDGDTVLQVSTRICADRPKRLL
uniref:class I lanthipeptide n=1 Tax=uncultured Tenacibaculum sp. TaxID=174713 RepID=UPI002601EE16|nr:class I lanthipeptide [uncultured Tenacibaculum sp.]